jgi:uncharacterized protein
VDRVFLDANILFSAAYRPGSSLRQLWTLANTELLASPFAIKEASDNLALARPAQLHDLSALLATVTQVPDPPGAAVLPPGVTLPDKDRPILLSAIDSRATHLLTGDVRHFGPYFGQSIGGVLILRPAAYLAARQKTP